jgi:putative Mn2+ efflux pump MntP
MDATAIAAARGAYEERVRAVDAALVAALFGGTHMAMPVLGALAGLGARAWIERWDHWIAFGLVVAIGARMVWSATLASVDARPPIRLGPVALFVVAIAASVDSLAVGITLPLLDTSIPLAIAIIGGVTAGASTVGLYVGHRLGVRASRRFAIGGGLVLVGVGTKILIEHLVSGT